MTAQLLVVVKRCIVLSRGERNLEEIYIVKKEVSGVRRIKKRIRENIGTGVVVGYNDRLRVTNEEWLSLIQLNDVGYTAG